MLYQNIMDTIGNTPLVKINGFNADSRAEIYVKLEFFNPGGSVKDRIALNILSEMERRGELKKGDTIIEPTSGNTGIGLAMIAAAKGYRAVFVMPATMSEERKMLLRAYGAELVLTEGAKGMKGAIEEAQRLVEEEGYVMMKQFDNPDNLKAHHKTTAKEILEDLPEIDAFVAGVGTGGTLTGTAQVLKEHRQDIRVIAVEPSSSPVLSGGQAGPHKIQGIGAGFIPSIMDMGIVDEITQVENEEALEYARRAAVEEGILLGISGGAAFFAALETAKKLGRGKKIVFLAADNGERYLSTDLYRHLSEK